MCSCCDQEPIEIEGNPAWYCWRHGDISERVIAEREPVETHFGANCRADDDGMMGPFGVWDPWAG
jgi:hypothetical protein